MCGNTRQCQVPISDIAIEPESSSIFEGLKMYMREEVLDDPNNLATCYGQCKTNTIQRKKLTLSHAPNVLMVYIKRYDMIRYVRYDMTVHGFV